MTSWQTRTLAEQVSDRLKFLETRLFEDADLKSRLCDDISTTRLIFIGHSIGCYTILEVLNQMNDKMRERVSHAFLLMPTIEKMRETPNGKWLTFASRYFTWLFYMLAFLVSVLPRTFQEFLVDRFTSFDFHAAESDLIDGLREIILNMGRLSNYYLD